ncbi:hypothetical protein [Aquirufa nivalisilvae]
MNIVNKISELVTEMGGGMMRPKNKDDTELIISFTSMGKSIVDRIQLKICHSENEFGVVLKSYITHNKFVSIKVWTYLLIEVLEREFQVDVILKGSISRYYFLGQKEFQDKN